MAVSFTARSIAVVVHEGQVLLVESKHSPGAWVPPGGKVEPGESLSEAAARESLEETGVEVQVGGLIAHRQVRGSGRDLLELYFAARPLSAPQTERTTGVEQRPARWVRLMDLTAVRHFPEELVELCAAVTAGGPAARCLVPIHLYAREA